MRREEEREGGEELLTVLGLDLDGFLSFRSYTLDLLSLPP